MVNVGFLFYVSMECNVGTLASYKQSIAPIVCVNGLYRYLFYGNCYSKFWIHKINLVSKEVSPLSY